MSSIPKIRFKGFTDDWEHRKLGDALVSLQNNTLSRADLSNESGVAKNIHYGDVLIKFGEVLDVRQEQLPMIQDESVLMKYKICSWIFRILFKFKYISQSVATFDAGDKSYINFKICYARYRYYLS